MACGFCRKGGHNQARCPSVELRKKYIYHMMCKILAPYRSLDLYGRFEMADTFFQCMSPDDIKRLSHYLFNAMCDSEEARRHTVNELAYDQRTNGRISIVQQIRYHHVDSMIRRLSQLFTFDWSTQFSGLSASEINTVKNNSLFDEIPAIHHNPLVSLPMDFLTDEEINRIRIVVFCPIGEDPVQIQFMVDPTIDIDRDVVDGIDVDCPVCYEPMTNVTVCVFACKHRMCVSCLTSCHERLAVGESLKCILCRTPGTLVSRCPR